MTLGSQQKPIQKAIYLLFLVSLPGMAHAAPSPTQNQVEAKVPESGSKALTIPVQRRETKSQLARLWGAQGRLIKRHITYADGKTLIAPVQFQADAPEFEVLLYPSSFEPLDQQTNNDDASRMTQITARKVKNLESVVTSDFRNEPRWSCSSGEIPGLAMIRTWTPEWQAISDCHLAGETCRSENIEKIGHKKWPHARPAPLLNRGIPLCVAWSTLE